MKALFIGGTGTISMAIVRRLAADPDWEVWLLNRGSRSDADPEFDEWCDKVIESLEKAKF